MRFGVNNSADRPLAVEFRPGDGAATLLERGRTLSVEWSGSGAAEVVCAPDTLTLRAPAGGYIRAWDTDGVPLPVGRWPDGLAAYPETPRTDLLIVNRSGVPFATGWEPVGQRWVLPADAGTVGVEWVGPPDDGCVLEWAAQDLLILHDGWTGGFRGWEPDGTEIETLAYLAGLPPDLARYGTPRHGPNCGCPR